MACVGAFCGGVAVQQAVGAGGGRCSCDQGASAGAYECCYIMLLSQVGLVTLVSSLCLSTVCLTAEILAGYRTSLIYT
jgi:hypothetical protein